MADYSHDFDWGKPLVNPKPNLNGKDYDVSGTPIFPLNPRELLHVIKTLFKSALPTSISCLCAFASGVVCLRYAGNYGTAAELAGVSLGLTWSAVFCNGILGSMNQGFNV